MKIPEQGLSRDAVFEPQVRPARQGVSSST